ncbi:DEAD/DEAH box helicase (plasmid) [Rhizobium ruizarguesonis]|uniref:DEAD/DEAH box helicase n=1 Tax=Rhizobium ruizarguesonis TaxID=2081791 RepID=UPI00103125DF|nr:DEAD/DEAH box helicase [Rhizobium ruizarguesonis]TBB62468.1 DEAD/DEAH box helicase [Rhizobium ruizarguesonis]
MAVGYAWTRLALACRTKRQRARRVLDCTSPIMLLASRSTSGHDGYGVFRPLLDLDSQKRRIDETCPPDAVLLRHTRHLGYRSRTQKSALRALLTMADAGNLMVCMPTGAGKSFLFQIAALVERSAEPGACVLVITPTVSLALDHERTLSEIPGLENARALVGASTPQDRDRRTETLNAFRRGEVLVLFISPELALGSARADLLDSAASPDEKLARLAGRLTSVSIDEAHIVESWGRTFRPDFQRLPSLIADLRADQPKLKTVLLSATLRRGRFSMVHMQELGIGSKSMPACLGVSSISPSRHLRIQRRATLNSTG